MSDIVRPSSSNPHAERTVINSRRHCLERRAGVTRSIYSSRRHLKSVNYILDILPLGLVESIYLFSFRTQKEKLHNYLELFVNQIVDIKANFLGTIEVLTYFNFLLDYIVMMTITILICELIM